jgi:hypothetical protein
MTYARDTGSARHVRLPSSEPLLERRMLRLSTLTLLAVATAATLTACYDRAITGPVTILSPPTNLVYQLEPSGNPAAPSGILLRWDAASDPELEAYRVYSRPSTTDAYVLRGTTTSATFHDNGIPHLQYYVTALSTSGGESDPSNAITVDERLALNAPATLTSVSLNGAIHLQWDDSPFLNNPNAFANYRVYSTSYDLDHNLCGATWSLEGNTVSPGFLVGVLTNGKPLCFGVSAVSIEGYESLWSPLRNDTPRPDARNVIVFSTDTLAGAQSGFRFWLDANGNGLVDAGELGLVGSSASGANDFTVTRDVNGLWLTPQRSVDSMQVYGSTPIADLTSIDLAPNGGYTRNQYKAAPLWGYVFQMTEGAFYKYGAIRVTAVGPNYVIFDWSYQTDPGNPELIVRAR